MMINNSENMFWSDVHNIKRFSENTSDNKNREARKTSSIILAAIQLMENYIKGIKNLSAYDAASLILSDSNWMRHNRRSDFLDDKGKKIVINPGTIYYIDFGNTFSDELAYFHHGLCIGKKDGKILIIPMTSGNKYFSNSYHPVNNPAASKKYRQALVSEGFGKDCVLKLNDAKFISPGRIDKETGLIHEDILRQIQEQLCSIQFPKVYQELCNLRKNKEKSQKQGMDQKKVISQLKQENNELKIKIKKYNNSIDMKQ